MTVYVCYLLCDEGYSSPEECFSKEQDAIDWCMKDVGCKIYKKMEVV